MTKPHTHTPTFHGEENRKRQTTSKIMCLVITRQPYLDARIFFRVKPLFDQSSPNQNFTPTIHHFDALASKGNGNKTENKTQK